MRSKPRRRSTQHRPSPVRRRKGPVGIIGLGYVGLPLACLAAEKGYRVIGVARDVQKINLINAHRSPIAEPLLKRWLQRVSIEATNEAVRLRSCSTIVVCVPTPIDTLNNPDLTAVKEAIESVRRYGQRGVLVILESTVNPGISEELILPILTRGGRREGRDFFLAHCPERIDPGNQKWNVRNIPRVIGAVSSIGLRKASAFYASVLEAPIKQMHTIKEAEAVKIVENSFRDVNIAFMNEVAKSFEKLGIDVVDVIEGAKTKPFAFLAHYPSCGVGGHCIPVDPYYLIERAKASGFDHKFLKLAREINNSMPAYTIERLTLGLNEVRKSVRGSEIAVLGVSYKANVADTRESPSFEIIRRLRDLGAVVRIFDPHVPSQSTVGKLRDAVRGVDGVILAVAHREFLTKLPSLLERKSSIIVVDGKNALDKESLVKRGFIYRGIGR